MIPNKVLLTIATQHAYEAAVVAACRADQQYFDACNGRFGRDGQFQAGDYALAIERADADIDLIRIFVQANRITLQGEPA